jgi:hypothetical protein
MLGARLNVDHLEVAAVAHKFAGNAVDSGDQFLASRLQ